MNCGCSNFKAGCKFWENLPVRSKLVIPREKSPPTMSIILGNILRDSFARVEQSLQEGLNDMMKVRDWSDTFLFLRLPMIYGWVIRAEEIVQDIPIGKEIYEKKIVSEMAVLAEALLVRGNFVRYFNSQQALRLFLIFGSVQEVW